jgi:DNA-binding transcriptional LysR family regulator
MQREKFNDILAFLTVARERSFTRAAASWAFLNLL